ncbi:MAG: hypothetical protein QOJ02_1540 [Acidobacteriota bacterium]|jgi:tetratricopeptide (TPR) repeat protein|nr:hypothetical protein [Acidobacteriota bacterium]
MRNGDASPERQTADAESPESYWENHWPSGAAPLEAGKADRTDYWRSGNAFYDKRDYEKACAEYEKAGEGLPDDLDLYMNWGNCLYHRDKYEEAIEKYKAVVEKDPHQYRALGNWGSALSESKKYDEAIEQLEKAKKVFAACLGERHQKITKYERILKKRREVLKRCKEAENLASEAGKKQYQDEISKCEAVIKKYEKLIRKQRSYADLWYNVGVIRYNLTQYDEAVKEFRLTVQHDPHYIAAYHNLAYILWKQGKFRQARDEWNRAFFYYERKTKEEEESIPEDLPKNFGEALHLILGQLDEAEKVFKGGLSKDGPADTMTSLVNLYLEKRDEVPSEATSAHWKATEMQQKAEKILRRQLVIPGESPHLQLGRLLMTKGECAYSEAENFLLKALEEDQNSVEIYTNLGILCMRKEDFKKSIQYFEAALRYDPDDFTLRSNLAEACLKANLLERAEAEYKNILTIIPHYVGAQTGLGEVYTAMADDRHEDMYDQAISRFDEAYAKSDSEESARKLKDKEKAKLLYSRGYAKVKLYESSSKVIKDEKLLRQAQEDFEKCYKLDSSQYKADRASKKIKERLDHSSPQHWVEQYGHFLVAILSLLLFLGVQAVTLGRYISGKPLSPGYYIPLTFGALIFIVAGLYMPQLLKIKVAGIELEKSAVDQITTLSSLNISKK